MRKSLNSLTHWGRFVVASVAIGALLWGANKGPDAGNYTATDSTVYSFVDPAGGGGSPSVLAGIDDGAALLTLPFPIQFYGTSYTMLCASTNGLAYFVTDPSGCAAPVDFQNRDLTSAAVPANLPAIVPFWTDLTFQVAGAGAVYYQTLGTPGNRQFVIEWYTAFPSGSTSPVTFEAVLYEGSNNILFQYQSVDLGKDNPAFKGAKATVGIRDAGGNSNQRQIQWSYDAAVLENNSAILFIAPSTTATSVNTIATVPPGLTVTVDNTPLVTPSAVSWVPGTTHTLSVVTPQTNGGTSTTLTSWSTGASTAQITVQAPDTGTTFTANFATQYKLTTSASPSNGGTVSGVGFYNAGTTATVQASAQTNYVFAGFSGDLTGTSNPQTLLMNGPKSVVANFNSQFVPCDLKQNNHIDVIDVQLIVNQALGLTQAINDLNGDGLVTIADIGIEVNASLGLGCVVR